MVQDQRIFGPTLVRYGTPYTSSLTEAKLDNAAASGDYAVIAGVASQIIKIYRVFFIVGGSTNITIKDGSTALTGAMPFNSGGAIVLDFMGEPWFTGTAGSALNINSSGAVQISGRIYYVQN